MKNIPENVHCVLEKLEKAGYEAWCVGGCVRDRLLGREPDDWDVTTNALPQETMEVFGPQAQPTGLQHGTVSVGMTGAHPIEVTTYRRDGEYRDHRRPESVSFTTSLKEDLRRRDFTVNAMAMDRWGEIFDPFGGQSDLEHGILRCVGEAEARLEEDALRIMRGLRFAAVLNLRMERDTAKAMHEKRGLLKEIAVERIQTELLKLLCGQWADRVLREFPDVVGVFWPEILPMMGFDQKNYHHCYDVWEHTLHAMAAVENDPVLRCVMLLHDIGKPDCFTVDEQGVGHFYGHPKRSAVLAEDMLRRLKCAKAFHETVVRLVAFHDRPIEPAERAVGRLLRQLGEEDFRRLLLIKRADNRGQAEAFWDYQQDIDAIEAVLERLLQEDACFSLKQLAVNGTDLIALGYAGPDVGKMLQELLDQVVDGVLANERDMLIAYARSARR